MAFSCYTEAAKGSSLYYVRVEVVRLVAVSHGLNWSYSSLCVLCVLCVSVVKTSLATGYGRGLTDTRQEKQQDSHLGIGHSQGAINPARDKYRECSKI